MLLPATITGVLLTCRNQIISSIDVNVQNGHLAAGHYKFKVMTP